MMGHTCTEAGGRYNMFCSLGPNNFSFPSSQMGHYSKIAQRSDPNHVNGSHKNHIGSDPLNVLFLSLNFHMFLFLPFEVSRMIAFYLKHWVEKLHAVCHKLLESQSFPALHDTHNGSTNCIPPICVDIL